MPTVARSGPACSAEPSEPSVSARTHEAPPCSSPYGWVLPATGIVPTTRLAAVARLILAIGCYGGPAGSRPAVLREPAGVRPLQRAQPADGQPPCVGPGH